MLRKPALAFAFVALLGGTLLAADKEIKGKVVKVDAEGRMITVQTADGKMEYKVNADAKVLDAKGAASKDGLKDKRLAAGTEVVLLIPEKGKNVREVQLVAADGKDKDPPKEVKGTPAKVLKVDVAKRTAQVELQGGKKVELKLGEDVKFIGPRGGVSDQGIKDDRFVAGNEIQIVYDKAGKTVTEVHLPYRKSDDKKDDKKDKK